MRQLRKSAPKTADAQKANRSALLICLALTDAFHFMQLTAQPPSEPNQMQ
jgi:hypothetical protein